MNNLSHRSGDRLQSESLLSATDKGIFKLAIARSTAHACNQPLIKLP